MSSDGSNFDVGILADLTFSLVTRCQEKEALFAQKYDMGIAEFRCLLHLYQNPGATVKQLADYMNLTSSRLTRKLINWLRKIWFHEQKEPMIAEFSSWI